MTINEGILLGNLALSTYLVWIIARLNQDIKTLFEGLAITMDAVGVKQTPTVEIKRGVTGIGALDRLTYPRGN